MALYCSKCGTAIVTGSKFCQSCGAPAPQPVQAAPPPPPPPPQQQWVAPPPVPPPPQQQQWAPPAYAAGQPAPPPKKSGGALKVILIALGVIVILIVVAVVGAGLFIKKAVLDNVSVKEGPGGKAEVSINTPKGQIKLNAKSEVSEEKLGVPIYPGAQAEEGSGSFSISGEGAKGGTFGGASFTTRDSVDKVVEFYKGRLGSKVNAFDSTSEGKHTVVLNVSAQDSWKTITIADEGTGVTKISVASLSGNSPQ
ncbi:MAG: zinc ribbon domain-containing protein [Terriglobia bacterium]